MWFAPKKGDVLNIVNKDQIDIHHVSGLELDFSISESVFFSYFIMIMKAKIRLVLSQC